MTDCCAIAEDTEFRYLLVQPNEARDSLTHGRSDLLHHSYVRNAHKLSSVEKTTCLVLKEDRGLD